MQFSSLFAKSLLPLVVVGSAVVGLPALAQDLTAGAVFAMSNDRAGNTVAAYARNADGTLDEVGFFNTGGLGSGSFEDTAHGLVLTDGAGEISPNNLVEPGAATQFLLATNAGSNSITVFEVQPTGLVVVDLQDSQGEKPVSVTVNNGLVYVLNSGETNDDLFDASGNVINNCTTGDRPEITGFTMAADGQLTPISGSSRRLSGERESGCAQVSFDAAGQNLIVTERLAQPKKLRQQTSPNERLDDEGVILVYPVNANGKTRSPRVVDATGQGPFGFTVARNGNILTTEQSDGPGGIARGTVASYSLSANVDGNSEKGSSPLLRTSPAIQNGGTDTCWFVITDDQTLGFTTSFFESARITSYRIDETGIVAVINAVASGPDAVNDDVALGASDLALSRDSQFLYQLNSVNGTVSAFSVNADGSLTLIEMEQPFPQPAFGPGGGQAAPLGLAGS